MNRNEYIRDVLTPKKGKIRVVIDTDAYNEVDDQFAIAWALKSTERMSVEAIYAAPFEKGGEWIINGKVETRQAYTAEEGMIASFHEIEKVLDLMKISTDNMVFKGSRQFLKNTKKPEESPAVLDLIKKAMNGEGILNVIAIGAITNVANAILLEPRIIDKIAVYWLGGHPLDFNIVREYNLAGDPYALNVVLDSKVPFALFPCMQVASHLTTTSAELEKYLKNTTPIANYLADRVIKEVDKENKPILGSHLRQGGVKFIDETPAEVLNMFETTSRAWSRIIWDLAPMAMLMNPSWTYSCYTKAPILTEEYKWAFDENRHEILECKYVSRDQIFGDLFDKVTDRK